MKSYLSLIPIYGGVHRRKSRMTRMCIALAVFLVTCIFGMAEMEMRSQLTQTEYSDGAWHVAFSKLTDEQMRQISARHEVRATSRYGVLNYRLDENYCIGGRETAICGFDAGFLEIMPGAALTAGSFPKSGEAALTEKAAAALGVAPGDKVELTLPDGTRRALTVSALTGDTSLLAENDAFGIYMNMDGFLELVATPDYEGNFYVRFTGMSGIRAKIDALCIELSIPAENVHENTKLLGIIGQSTDSYMMQLYGTAAVLAVLVVTAGVLMIGSSLNADVARRMQFYGLLRCLGSTPKQVRRYVRLEALSWCALAIPSGLICALVVTWLLCGILRLLAPGYFALMPLFGVSVTALLLGAVLGVATVIAAAASPARRASKASPLEAMRGNTRTDAAVKRAANTGSLPVEYALGVRHAVSNGRSFFLMAGSFALSIILFLSFTTAIDFLNHAIRPLKPYSPDISIVSRDNSCSVPADKLTALQNDPVVKRAYGRMFAYNVPVQTEGGEIRVNLISYERYQFNWARSGVLEGGLDKAQCGSGVLTVYDAENPLALGDMLTADFGTGAAELSVCGVLADCPFTREAGVETLICSEELFTHLTGESAYTIIDIQLNGKATESDVSDIRAIFGGEVEFSDKRLSNQEIRGAFYSMSVFMYGFLCIIALIAAFNIINSMAMSVEARTRQYGSMRAVGMSDTQLYRMTLTEGLSYALFGVFSGAAAGLPLNRLLFKMLVTSHWGDVWRFPLLPVLIIVFIVLFSTLLSVRGPARHIRQMTIVETIHAD